MRKPKRSIVLIVLALVAVMAAAVLYANRPRPVLLIQNFPLVRVGLTQDEVESLLGGPPGNYGSNTGQGMMTAEGYDRPQGSVEKVWSDDNNRFEIYFDAHGIVVGHHKRAGYSQSFPAFPVPGDGWFDRSCRSIRRWFGL